MKKTTVALLFGGVSSEHDISCISAASVLRQLPKERYDVIKVGITKDGRWLLYSGDSDGMEQHTWADHPQNKTAFLVPDRAFQGLFVVEGDSHSFLSVDVVFPVLHGKNGEDGTLQGLLQMNGIPFVGCDLLSSISCMDKATTNLLLEMAGIPQASFVWLYSTEYAKRRQELLDAIKTKLGGYPVFVKPCSAGSSVGVSKVKSEAELDAAIAKAAKEDSRIVIEEAIAGQEVECAVLGNEEPKASVVGEIGVGAEFYDYADKYVNGVSQLYIPARIPEETAKEIQQTAIRAYRALGCCGLARVDFFVREKDGKIFLNELNTLPGFTAISMYPKLWAECGLAYPELLTALIDYAFAKAEEEKAGQCHG